MTAVDAVEAAARELPDAHLRESLRRAMAATAAAQTVDGVAAFGTNAMREED